MQQPTHAPAELLEISPESLEIANLYLQYQDQQQVANQLNLPVEIVNRTLAKREVRSYIDQVFYDIGFNNRFQLRELMDTLIKQKLEEMQEAGIGSSKDILDLIALSHKMTMEHLDKEIQLEKLRYQQQQSNIKSQVNVQINELGDGTKYGQLINRLLNPDA